MFGLVNMLVFSSPAFASGPLEYINPKDAVLVTDAASSTDVKTGREGLQDLINKLDSLKSDLEKNRQAEVSDRVQKEFRLDAVRETLNKVTDNQYLPISHLTLSYSLMAPSPRIRSVEVIVSFVYSCRTSLISRERDK